MRALIVALAASGLLTTAAAADVRITEKVETYAVSGDDGMQVVASMDRRGPRQGWMARAIAQTRYTVGWEMKWQQTNGACRLAAADADLAITTKYPMLSTNTPMLQQRWTRFMQGVRTHESNHARIARQMVGDAYRKVMAVRTSGDPSCTRAKRIASELVKATYARYEARQVAFDLAEHRPGGKVERLVGRLVGY